MNYGFKNQVLDYWRGRERLWRAFWILNILIPLCVGLLLAIIFAFVDVSLKDLDTIFAVLIPVTLPYTIFVYVSVWRCAPNTDNQIWTYLARGWIVIGVIRSILGLISLIQPAS